MSGCTCRRIPAAGVPLSARRALKVTPLGNAPDSPRVAGGNPLAVRVKLPALPTVNVALLALVIAGAWSTVSVKLWAARLADAVCGGEAQSVSAGRVPAAGVPAQHAR